VAEVGTSKITGVQGSHNKPIGCGASGVYAPGPDEGEEELQEGKNKFSPNTNNLLSIKLATCFDSRSHHQANY
jgi:hypothetical protein